ncbi:MAG: exodeoxyribonuclease VII large subunit [Bacteroidales bacterium]|jgi:exodeoxyribonuclease VII large subunit|nr:exodeoxyribonuclease VII large subunit [Bacteroidales bacterium]
MSEKINDKRVFSLLEVSMSIHKTLEKRYQSSFWVKAEMSKLNFYKYSGHCYPELVEKQNGKVIVQLKSYIWKEDYQKINNKFINTLREPLKDGIKILFLAKITFDPAHGLSLWIMDIDPSYTLGDLEREKQDTIYQLKNESIFNRNKTLHLPLLPQRIAIISVETSKGYADFIKVIETNPWNYKFFCYLFPSVLQGDYAVQSIIKQLERIKKVMHHFDVVAIIRGGGGDIGLSCFNNYQLSKAVALFPLPVITGIGHATNETVVEMIAFTNVITPTKLAEYLLQKFHNFTIPVQNAEKKISEWATRQLNEEKIKLASKMKSFCLSTDNILISNNNEIKASKRNIVKGVSVFCNMKNILIDQLKEKLRLQSLLKMKNSLMEINSMEKNVDNMNPANVLKRGYSITLLNGKSVTNISQIKTGDVLNTVVSQGNIVSTVNSIHKNNKE